MGTCTLDVSIFGSFPLAHDSSGVARVQFTVPSDPALFGGEVGTQAAVIDLGTATPTKVVHSAGLLTRVGGVR
jgi:hypothetical protein